MEKQLPVIIIRAIDCGASVKNGCPFYAELGEKNEGKCMDYQRPILIGLLRAIYSYPFQLVLAIGSAF